MNTEADILSEAVVEAVRMANREGRAVTHEEVCIALSGQGVESSDVEPSLGSRVAAVLAGSSALASFSGVDGRLRYHDTTLLSATYARIMDRRSSPLILMVEEIRLNSRDYPRPIPMALFLAPPFDLTPEEIDHACTAMTRVADYQDISVTTTSSGTVYLFSNLYLESRYAGFLAEYAENMVISL